MLVVLGLSELLRRQVRHHVVRWAVLQCHLVRRDGLAYEVVANFDVLGALVLDGVLGEVNAPAVFDPDVDRPAATMSSVAQCCSATLSVVMASRTKW